MSILVLLMALHSVAETRDGLVDEDAVFCRSAQSIQPYDMCLGDRASERAASELTVTLERARAAAIRDRAAFRARMKSNVRVTFVADPVRALDESQRLWERSYRSDCAIDALRFQMSFTSTASVTRDLDCAAERITARIAFLNQNYALK